MVQSDDGRRGGGTPSQRDLERSRAKDLSRSFRSGNRVIELSNNALKLTAPAFRSAAA
jgi:hypothetical protein